jgi:hypothetical protein
MNDSDRTELFAALLELAQLYPHWRVGQLVANVAGWADAEVWDAEDEQLLAAMRTHLGAGPRLNGESSAPNQAMQQTGAAPVIPS